MRKPGWLHIALSLYLLIAHKAVGVQWDNIDKPVTVDDNITFGQLLVMFIADSFLYLLIMWYVEAVFPGDYGIPQKPYFLFTVSS